MDPGYTTFDPSADQSQVIAQYNPSGSTAPANITAAGNASGIAATAPAPYQAFGATPSVTPTYGQATTVDPNQAQQYYNQYAALYQQSLAPGFAQQQQQLQDSDAARGISNSGAAGYLQGNLLGQQAGQVASGLAGFTGQEYANTQADIQGNQAAQNQYGLANLGYANQASDTNAGYYAQGLGANMNAYNNYQNELLGLGGALLSAEQSAYLNSYGPNTGGESAYGSALSGMQNTYGTIYGQGIAAQGQEFQALGEAAGAGG